MKSLVNMINPNFWKHVCHLTTDKTSSLSSKSIFSDSNKIQCIKILKSMKPVNVSKSNDKKLAAILVPLCIIDDQPSLLYTVRSPYLKVNGGQVSFPGGKKDKSDRTLLDTALRETFEEIGVATDKVAVWGSGPQIHRTDVIVTPFLGYIGNITINNLKINNGEVAEVFTATLSHLSEKKNFHSTLFRFNNTHVYNTPVYTGTHKRIWGLTAVITHIILSALIPDIYNSNITFKLSYHKIFQVKGH